MSILGSRANEVFLGYGQVWQLEQ